MANTTAPVSTTAISAPFTPAPENRLLFGGALLGWAFLTVTVVGLLVFGAVCYYMRKQQHSPNLSDDQTRIRANLQSRPVQARAAEGSMRDSEGGVELRELHPVPRAGGTNWKGPANEEPGYEDTMTEHERRRAHDRLADGQDVDRDGIIGQAL
ncbi:hypothetical protein P171DRAFT_516745 [Karstenula rhodostoma CBS 690.94]|uniref:Transmembrane protein n=1 Tax=Karstenula rhodostoma CBS 690.94 TaxID=1392251 RepID=A0A9P4PTD1_9PLEO|nr:hypothetical protein P171DRAFT_516745 [Karstenula rhodostoma CBS 690.94]